MSHHNRVLGVAGWVLLAAPLLAAAQAPSPGGLYDARSFGARGDGSADDTGAINAAIAAAAQAGGGTVDLPAGSYLSGSVHLRSNVELHLGPGATLLASSDEKAYDPPEANAWGDVRHYQDFGHS
ncbi:MAG TPA: glycosyl hydrolase family 28-related protein, partial [Opitutaceae bacterium]